MFIVDTVSFLSLWHLFGECVYTLLSAGIYQAKIPIGKCDLFFMLLCFKRLSGYKKSLKLVRAHDFKINNSNYRALL